VSNQGSLLCLTLPQLSHSSKHMGICFEERTCTLVLLSSPLQDTSQPQRYSPVYINTLMQRDHAKAPVCRAIPLATKCAKRIAHTAHLRCRSKLVCSNAVVQP
jgi:hypothetical protein